MGRLTAMVGAVKALGLETCMTLGMLTPHDAQRLAQAGLDYYNHNIDTSERYYNQVATTRTWADRLDTLKHVRESGMKVCCGGIVGMGEEAVDRVAFLVALANLPGAAGKRADQPADPDSRNAASRCAAARPDRVRAHHRARPHPHAGLHGAAVRGTHAR